MCVNVLQTFNLLLHFQKTFLHLPPVVLCLINYQHYEKVYNVDCLAI